MKSKINKRLAFEAVRQVAGALTEVRGTDCVLYACLTAGLLRTLGAKAEVQGGGASWRIGPGGGDVVSHEPEVKNGVYAAQVGGISLPFHAWVRIAKSGRAELVDFTTFQLPEKAAALDRMDGGRTAVLWSPDYIWISEPPARTLRQVAQAHEPGIYRYARHAWVTELVASREPDFAQAIEAARLVYANLAQGLTTEVAGVGEDGLQLSDDERSIALVPLSGLEIAKVR